MLFTVRSPGGGSRANHLTQGTSSAPPPTRAQMAKDTSSHTKWLLRRRMPSTQ
jgi:hypothetical protein